MTDIVEKRIDTREITNVILDELQKRNLIKEVKNSFKNTESLLYNYKKLKDSIKKNQEQIKDLKEFGIPTIGHSKDVVLIPTGGNYDPDSLVAIRIKSLEEANIRTKSIIKHIDRLLLDLKTKNKYYKIIELFYFKDMTYEEILSEKDEKGYPIFNCDISTISRNKNKMINELKILLFPNSFVDELGY